MRDVDVAEPFDVGEHLVGAGPGGGAGGREGIADQYDAGLPIAGGDIEIGGPDLDSPATLNSPVMRRSLGIAAFMVSSGALRIWRSQGSSISR